MNFKTSFKTSLGMTGTRNGMTNDAKNVLINFLSNNTIKEVHHGDCIGADKDFHDICKSHDEIKIIIHPPNEDICRAYCKGDIIKPKKTISSAK